MLLSHSTPEHLNLTKIRWTHLRSEGRWDTAFEGDRDSINARWDGDDLGAAQLDADAAQMAGQAGQGTAA
jgi:hypothetical protein